MRRAGGGETTEPELVARLESPLPRGLAVGSGNCLFVWGTCFHQSRAIRELRIGLRGAEQPASAFGMPRPDLFEALHPNHDPLAASGVDPRSDEDPLGRSYRSGFWAIAGLDPVTAPTRAELSALAVLEGGGEARASLGELELLPALGEPDPWPSGAASESSRVAICMATFDPPPELFASQVESIRAQTHADWACFISDDASSPERLGEMVAVLGDDHRFVLSRSARRLGHYGNFERALGMAPAESDYVALCDQDDRWNPEKLATLVAEIGDANLVYSDTRLVDPRGTVIAGTYWSRRRNNHTNLGSMLIANTVTGAASLMRRDLLELALPFPPRLGHPYHDHWLAVAALATGRIAYVDRPLYDYVQHRQAQIGHAAANAGSPRGPRALAARVRRSASAPHRTFASWRAMYFFDVCRIALFAAVLDRRTGAEPIAPRKRRVLRRVVDVGGSWPSFAWLGARRLRALAGRTETMGAEGALMRGLAWRRLAAALSGRRRPFPQVRGDSRVPSLAEASGQGLIAHQATRTLADKTRPLDLDVREDAPVRVNLLLPTIDLRHFFGGYGAKLNLARRLAERGRRVRLVTVDPTPPLPRSWRAEVESYDGLEGVFDLVEVEFGREAAPVAVNPADAFIATTWWTAHVAAAAVEAVEASRFLYLIQEYEPFTFAMGSYAAAAAESYELPHRALFSTELLREWFRREQLGVFAAGADAGDRDSVAFQNAITAVPKPSAAALEARSSRRLLFYARPEAHAARNMFELGLLALARAVEDGAVGSEWELHGVGGVSETPSIELGRGAVLELMPRRAQSDYASLLEQYDVGLALMYTPHPSLVPIEMASAGMLTVTNSFANKTPEAMAAISTNLITVAPSVEAVAAGLADAVRSSPDFERRSAGAAVNWSRDWEASFPDELLERIEGLADGS